MDMMIVQIVLSIQIEILIIVLIQIYDKVYYWYKK